MASVILSRDSKGRLPSPFSSSAVLRNRLNTAFLKSLLSEGAEDPTPTLEGLKLELKFYGSWIHAYFPFVISPLCCTTG